MVNWRNSLLWLQYDKMWKLHNLMLYSMRLGAGEDENWGREKRRVSSVQWREKTRLVLSETRWVPDLFVCSNPGFTPDRSRVPLLDLKYCSTSRRQFWPSPLTTGLIPFSGTATSNRIWEPELPNTKQEMLQIKAATIWLPDLQFQMNPGLHFQLIRYLEQLEKITCLQNRVLY